MMQNQNQTPKNNQSGGLNIGGIKLDGRTIAIIAVVVIALIVFVIPALTRNNNDTDPEGNNLEESRSTVQAPDTGIQLGDFVAGTQLDRNSCVTNEVDTFDRDDTIYVGLESSEIPADVPVFVRLFRGDTAIEDTEEITSPEDYEGCVWFEFTATANAEVFQTGNYEAEVFINGNPADTIAFQIE